MQKTAYENPSQLRWINRLRKGVTSGGDSPRRAEEAPSIFETGCKKEQPTISLAVPQCEKSFTRTRTYSSRREEAALPRKGDGGRAGVPCNVVQTVRHLGIQRVLCGHRQRRATTVDGVEDNRIQPIRGHLPRTTKKEKNRGSGSCFSVGQSRFGGAVGGGAAGQTIIGKK